MGKQLTIIVDTGTWLKLDFLSSIDLFSPEQIYSWNQVIVSHQVEEELTHFQCKSFTKKNTRILPINNMEIYNEAISLGFDDADASLASMGEKNSNSTIIVTEDRPLLDYLELNKIAAIQFAELLQIYTDMGKIEGKVFYRLTKELQERRNITKQKMNTLLKWKAERFK
jgi:rRNA-processing protein FCF1